MCIEDKLAETHTHIYINKPLLNRRTSLALPLKYLFKLSAVSLNQLYLRNTLFEFLPHYSGGNPVRQLLVFNHIGIWKRLTAGKWNRKQNISKAPRRIQIERAEYEYFPEFMEPMETNSIYEINLKRQFIYWKGKVCEVVE